jgi:hypothetical protein
MVSRPGGRCACRLRACGRAGGAPWGRLGRLCGRCSEGARRRSACSRWSSVVVALHRAGGRCRTPGGEATSDRSEASTGRVGGDLCAFGPRARYRESAAIICVGGDLILGRAGTSSILVSLSWCSRGRRRRLPRAKGRSWADSPLCSPRLGMVCLRSRRVYGCDACDDDRWSRAGSLLGGGARGLGRSWASAARAGCCA